MSKDKHALIKANIVLNKKVQELERDVRYLRERENKIIEINQHRMKYLAEVESRNIVLEQQNKRYREEIKKILIEMEHDMKLYSDRYGENYNFERYDEVRDYYHLLEDVLEG